MRALASELGWSHSEDVADGWGLTEVPLVQIEVSRIRSIRLWLGGDEIYLEARGAGRNGQGIELSESVADASVELILELARALAVQPWDGSAGQSAVRVKDRHYLFFVDEASIPVDADDLWAASADSTSGPAELPLRTRVVFNAKLLVVLALIWIAVIAYVFIRVWSDGGPERGSVGAEVPEGIWWTLGGGAVAILTVWGLIEVLLTIRRRAREWTTSTRR